MKITVQKIADMCGVSRGTVDRVLNGREGVAPDVRARIEKAIAETGYQTPSMRKKQPSHQIKVGFIIPRWDIRYYTAQMRQGIERARRQIHDDQFEIITHEMQGRSVQEYIRCIREMEAQGVKGLVLNTRNIHLLQQEIDRLFQKGIAVVTCNSDVPDSRRICHIGQNLARSGRMAAGLMARLVSSGDILIITGNSEFTAHRGRVNGFYTRAEEVFSEQVQLKLAECIERYDLTFDAVTREVRTNPRLRGIYMATESVQGCIDALIREKKDHKIHVICNDLTPWSRQYLLEDRVRFVIDQDFCGQSTRAVITLYEYLFRGKSPAAETEFVTTSVITREMIE